MNRMDTGDLLGQPNNMLGGNLALASRGSINTSGRLHAIKTGISSDSARAGQVWPRTALPFTYFEEGFIQGRCLIVTGQ